MTHTAETGDELIAMLASLQERIRDHTFPALTVEEITDDRETFTVIRCPRCDTIVDTDNLFTVDTCERQNPADDLDSDWALQHQKATFSTSSATFGEPLYYLHGDHAVSLPDGWDLAWT